METCSIEGCVLPVFVKSRGWCRRHYYRWWKNGDPLAAAYDRASGTDLQRWWAKVDRQEGSCWLWQGSLDRRGYGQFNATGDDGKKVTRRAHRWGYEQLVRPLLANEDMDHLCRTPACVNPSHLEPVSHLENVSRGLAGQHNAIKTHCAQGHEFSTENTSVNRAGWRECITCRREWARKAQARYRARKRAEAAASE